MSDNGDERCVARYDEAVQFAQAKLSKGSAAFDDQGAFDKEGWQKCADFGLLTLGVPKAFGGEGASLSELISVMEGLGYGCEDTGLLFSLNAHLWTVVLPLAIHGTPEQRSHFLPGLVGGALLGANAATEEHAGSDIFALRTHAMRDGDDYVLNGAKIFITNAPVADVFVIYATIAPELESLGVTAFLVEANNPGLTLSPPLATMGLRTAPMGKITLTDCRVPASAILGKAGRGALIFESAMEYERGCILATALGAMRRHLEACIHHARTRKQFGQAIGKYQGVANRIVDMKVGLDAARELVYRIGRLKDAGEDAMMAAASAKLFVSEVYTKFSIDVMRIYGAQGYLANSMAERGIRDSMASMIYSGTSDIQRNIIATALGL